MCKDSFCGGCVGQCEGRECGKDPCGNSCGTCPEGKTCLFHVCGCLNGCDGRECGTDACGNSCGTCPALTDACSDAGQCVDTVGLVWVTVPEGQFQMGSPYGMGLPCPQHLVVLNHPFKMTEAEITESQYKAVMGFLPPQCGSSPAELPDGPVVCVGRSEALQFCEAVGGRLPTEAEWEYAARAGNQGDLFPGCDATFSEVYPACVNDLMWWAYNSPMDGLAVLTSPVKTKPHNAFGLYDMLGSVNEWVSDWLDCNYQGAYDGSFCGYYFEMANGEVSNVNPQGPAQGAPIYRGGAYDQDAVPVWWRPDQTPGWGTWNVGFRCAKSI